MRFSALVLVAALLSGEEWAVSPSNHNKWSGKDDAGNRMEIEMEPRVLIGGIICLRETKFAKAGFSGMEQYAFMGEVSGSLVIRRRSWLTNRDGDATCDETLYYPILGNGAVFIPLKGGGVALTKRGTYTCAVAFIVGK